MISKEKLYVQSKAYVATATDYENELLESATESKPETGHSRIVMLTPSA